MLQNEGTKKTSQKAAQKPILEAKLASKTHPKLNKKLVKTILKKHLKKKTKKRQHDPNKKTCLSKWTGSAIFLKKCGHKVKREKTKEGKEQPETE